MDQFRHVSRRNILTGAVAATLLPFSEARAQLVNYHYVWTGLPPAQPGLVLQPWNPVWINNPVIGWNVNPPTSAFFHELKHWTEITPGWNKMYPNLEALLTAFHAFKTQPPPLITLHIGHAWGWGESEGMWLRGYLHARDVTPEHSLAAVIRLTKALAAIGIGSLSTVVGVRTIVQGMLAGTFVMSVMLTGTGTLLVLTGLTALAAGIMTLHIFLESDWRHDIPNTTGWPIPEGYDMQLPYAHYNFFS